MRVYIIGTGMDGGKTLTAEAMSVIKAADVLVGAERMLEPFLMLGKPIFIGWKSSEIVDFLKLCKAETAAVLMSGDCGFFSGAEKLLKALDGFETEIISGIASPLYFCSKIKKAWQDMKFVSLHGTEGSIVRNVCRNELCFFLLGGNITPADICRRLCEYERSSVKVYIGENLAYANERIYSGIAEDFTDLSCEKLCVMAAENPHFENGTACGIPDNKFTRGDVPMTKAMVRAAVISRLNIGRKDICWDIGSGTGSVSVEMALQCFDGRVYAIDKSKKASELTKNNCRKFGCDNVEISCMEAPSCLTALPSPDKVFIGGSCGKLNEIIGAVYAKNPNAVIVMTSVSLETLTNALTAFGEYGIASPEVVQLAVTGTRKAGMHTMLSAENPVFIIKGARN